MHSSMQYMQLLYIYYFMEFQLLISYLLLF